MGTRCTKCSTIFSTDEEFSGHNCTIQINASKGALIGIVRLSEDDLSKEGFDSFSGALVNKMNEYSGSDFQFLTLPEKKVNEHVISRMLIIGKRKK
jgi:hypothetical protein